MFRHALFVQPLVIPLQILPSEDPKVDMYCQVGVQ